MSKIAVIGMVGNSAFMPVEKFHVGGETVAAKDVHFEPGGKGYNQAVAAARMGAQVSFLGAVGTQGYESIRDFSRAEGIHAALIQKQGPTAFATILTDALGANQVTVYQGAPLDVEDVDAFAAEIRQADLLMLSNEVPQEVNVRAIEIAKEADTFVLLNPAPARATCKYILDHVDLFTPNEHETMGLEGKTNVVVTLGSKGSCLCQSGVIVPAKAQGPVVDTTGAGDTFNGALAVKLAEGAGLQSAVEYATIASGIGVTRRYAASSIPGKADIDKCIGER